MLPRIHKEGDDGFFAKRLGGLQPVQTLNKDEARAVRPYQDRRLQALVENAGRDLVYSFWHEGRTTLGRNVDVSDWDGLALHHDEPRVSQPQPATSTRVSQATFSYLRHQCIEQCLRLLPIARVEPLREPPENLSKQFVPLLRLALVTPQAREVSIASSMQRRASVAKDDTHFFEVLIRQVRQDAKIDAVVGKTLGVLGQAKLIEPFGNLLHSGKPIGLSFLWE